MGIRKWEGVRHVGVGKNGGESVSSVSRGEAGRVVGLEGRDG